MTETLAPPTPRRRLPWGALLADAPWDGRAREPTPIRIPMTAAARLPAPESTPTTPRARKRLPFGQLLAACPWNAPILESR